MIKRVNESKGSKSFEYKGYRVYDDGSGWCAYKGNKKVSPTMEHDKEVIEWIDKEANESTQLGDVSTGRPADTSITYTQDDLKKEQMNESIDFTKHLGTGGLEVTDAATNGVFYSMADRLESDLIKNKIMTGKNDFKSIAAMKEKGKFVLTTKSGNKVYIKRMGMNESADIATAFDADIPTPEKTASINTGMTIGEDIVPERRNDSKKYTDQKYMDILNMLKSNGYPDAKFFGSEGYIMPDQSSDDPVLCRLVCRTISEGFKVNVIGGLYDMATSKLFNKQFNAARSLADKLNQILIADQSDLNEMVEGKIDGELLCD